MTNAIDPGDARAALAEIRQRQSQVIEGTLVPAWYWWVIGVPAVGLGAVVDTRIASAILVAALAFAAWAAGLTAWVIFGGLRNVKVHESLLGSGGAGLIVGFVWLLVAGTIALAFALQAVGFAYPGTLSTLACAVGLVLGGPALMRRLRGIMGRRRSGAS